MTEDSDSVPTTTLLRFEVPIEHDSARVDAYLAIQINGYSRMFLRGVVQEGKVRVNGEVVRPSFRVHTGHVVEIDLPPPPEDGPRAEDIALDVLFEDEHLIAINKPSAMVVHPAKGHWSGTLTSALAFRFQQLSDVGGPTRPGIVHRLDRDTSGVIVIAKTNAVHLKLSGLFESRDVKKQYTAICVGRMDRDRDRIVAPIGNHPYQRDKMAIRSDHESSRDAESVYEVVERFDGYTLLNVLPKTGRTHQIRVHLSHIGHAILCDRLYAGHARVTRGQLLRKQALGFPMEGADHDVVLARQALHASRLEFEHPVSGEMMSLFAPLAADIESTLAVLRTQVRPPTSRRN